MTSFLESVWNHHNARYFGGSLVPGPVILKRYHPEARALFAARHNAIVLFADTIRDSVPDGTNFKRLCSDLVLHEMIHQYTYQHHGLLCATHTEPLWQAVVNELRPQLEIQKLSFKSFNRDELSIFPLANRPFAFYDAPAPRRAAKKRASSRKYEIWKQAVLSESDQWREVAVDDGFCEYDESDEFTCPLPQQRAKTRQRTPQRARLGAAAI